MPKKKQKPKKEINVRKPFDFGKLIFVMFVFLALFCLGLTFGLINIVLLLLLIVLWIIKTPINLLITAIVIVIIWVVIRGMKDDKS